MNGRLWLRLMFAVALLASFSLSGTALAAAPDGAARGGGPGHPGQPGDPGQPWQRYVVTGVITAIEQDGALVTIDRGDQDADPADDLLVSVTDETQIKPSGAELAVDDAVRAMLIPPEVEGDPYTAQMIMLGDHQAQPPNQPQPEKHKAQHVCGDITVLPDAPGFLGTWTIEAPRLGEYEIGVTAETVIEPADVEPEVGMHACAWGDNTEGLLVASRVQLGQCEAEPGSGEPGHGPGPGPGSGPGRGQEQRAVHFEGEVTSVDEAGEVDVWTIATEDGALTVTVTEKTALVGFGDDPLGEQVEGVATPDEDGNLIARMIRVE